MDNIIIAYKAYGKELQVEMITASLSVLSYPAALADINAIEQETKNHCHYLPL